MTEAARITERFLRRVQAAGIPVSLAYLFGSHAKGGATGVSDIDVCIVSPVFGVDPIGEMVKLRKIALTIDSRIEPIALSEEGFSNRYSTLTSEIKRYGRPIAIASGF